MRRPTNASLVCLLPFIFFLPPSIPPFIFCAAFCFSRFHLSNVTIPSPTSTDSLCEELPSFSSPAAETLPTLVEWNNGRTVSAHAYSLFLYLYFSALFPSGTDCLSLDVVAPFSPFRFRPLALFWASFPSAPSRPYKRRPACFDLSPTSRGKAARFVSPNLRKFCFALARFSNPCTAFSRQRKEEVR